jgi:RNA polymerase sigma-70 factor (ECF subfamily)
VAHTPATTTTSWFPDESTRQRLVAVCTTINGDPQAAEDLAQETLIEAWRNLHKLSDIDGADRWLNAIARNVCRRGARRTARDAARSAPLDDGVDLAGPPHEVEMELERAELADLLNRALDLLPAQTRDVLVHRYVHEASCARIGAAMGLSPDAVSMRISRGRVVLRRLLQTELHDSNDGYGLAAPPDDDWRQTSVWCTDCGQHRLAMRRHPTLSSISFRCGGCDRGSISSEFRLDNPVFGRLMRDAVRPSTVIARAADWVHSYFAAGGESGRTLCTRCGQSVPLSPYLRRDAGGDPLTGRGLAAECSACNEAVSSSLGGLALATPAGRTLRRRHPRLRALPTAVPRSGPVTARYQDMQGRECVEVDFAPDTLRILSTRTRTL